MKTEQTVLSNRPTSPKHNNPNPKPKRQPPPPKSRSSAPKQRTCASRGARAPLTVHLAPDVRDKPARVGVIDDHGMNGGLLMPVAAIYKQKHRPRFCQLWCILPFLSQTPLEGPAQRLKRLFSFGIARSHVLKRPWNHVCCLVTLLVNILRSSLLGDGAPRVKGDEEIGSA